MRSEMRYYQVAYDADLTISNITRKVIVLRQLWDKEKKEHEATLRTLDEVRREKNAEIADLKDQQDRIMEFVNAPRTPWWKHSLIKWAAHKLGASS